MRKDATKEKVKHKDKLDQLLEMVGLKQEQILIKYLFRPFWGTIVAIASFLTGVLLAVGSWIPSAVTIILVCFALYECLKLRARLKILNFLP